MQRQLQRQLQQQLLKWLLKGGVYHFREVTQMVGWRVQKWGCRGIKKAPKGAVLLGFR